MKMSRATPAFVLAAALLAGFTAITSFDVSAHTKFKVGGICGGLAGFQCRRGLFCDYEPAAQCGAADQTGTCARRPGVCTMDYKPVCGCDGKTYGNDCARKVAGIGKVKNGACGP